MTRPLGSWTAPSVGPLSATRSGAPPLPSSAGGGPPLGSWCTASVAVLSAAALLVSPLPVDPPLPQQASACSYSIESAMTGRDLYH